MRELLALGQWEYEARRAEVPSGARREGDAEIKTAFGGRSDDRRGRRQPCGGILSPVPLGGRGDRDVGLRSGPISRGETKTAAVWLP